MARGSTRRRRCAAVTGGRGGAVGDLLAPFEDATLEQSEVTGFQLGGADGSSSEALIEDERAHLGPHVPSVDPFILSGAPHDLNQALDAQEYFTAVNDWITATLGI